MLTMVGRGSMWDALGSQIRSGGAMVMLLATSFHSALQMLVVLDKKKKRKRGGEAAYGVSLVGDGWLASSAALSALIFL